ncbi:MAG: RnfABCDGE type electron transport complex subunit E [Ruminococcaceae bacterium]|nr:RnfABCDGE type electron transport complex subunit E [Oscillospiraceae bacterium]
MNKNSSMSVLFKGILKENPVFVLILGTCPTLATTTNVVGAFGMGIAALAVLVCSNILISLLRKIIPDSVRIPCYIVVIAGFVTMVQMIVQAFFPALYEMLGVYLPLITVNCIILGRAEMFAGKNSVGKSALDGIGMGLGFTLALVAMATIREVFGAAAFAGIAIPFLEPYKIEVLVKAPGGMMVYGLLIALVYALTHGKAPMKKSFSCAGCPNAGNCHTAACGAENTDNVHNEAATEKGGAQ